MLQTKGNKSKVFPNGREHIATIHTYDHDNVKVYMPTVQDAINNPIDDMETFYKLVAVCINVPWDEFKQWSMADMQACVDVVSEALIKLKPNITRR